MPTIDIGHDLTCKAIFAKGDLKAATVLVWVGAAAGSFLRHWHVIAAVNAVEGRLVLVLGAATKDALVVVLLLFQQLLVFLLLDLIYHPVDKVLQHSLATTELC